MKILKRLLKVILGVVAAITAFALLLYASDSVFWGAPVHLSGRQ